MKRVLIIGAALLLLLFIIGIGSDKETKSTEAETTNKASTETTLEETEKSNWTYSEKKDEMDGTVTKFAESTSTNSLNFKFPYQGGSYGTLTIRNKNSENQVLLSISKGQFMSGMFNDLRVKFDDEPPVKFGYSDPASASADILFINNSKKFIEKLKKASHVKIEATYYDEGNQILEFDISGLTW